METTIRLKMRRWSVSSYRTYEEWKLTGGSGTGKTTYAFLPYLWGMETLLCLYPISNRVNSSYRTYEEWKQAVQNAITLTKMRSYRTYEEWKRTSVHATTIEGVWFLPYLWGMETCFYLWTKSSERKFLPYLWGMETIFLLLLYPFISRSYRTYEEWKPGAADIIWKVKNGSYRTYEEWKHGYLWVKELQKRGFLPYLWGMETGSCKAV